ncbi:hypothetical protein GCM10009745_74900 [Kribbella yunnanensis]|uniref:Uncharacterized protein n=1 Tax=Kribbella yunnanensis TaxID=190194 RepID=A0ABP4V593_9ACTN
MADRRFRPTRKTAWLGAAVAEVDGAVGDRGCRSLGAAGLWAPCGTEACWQLTHPAPHQSRASSCVERGGALGGNFFAYGAPKLPINETSAEGAGWVRAPSLAQEKLTE